MTAALLVIDCQMEFARRTLAGVPRSNLGAEAAIAATIALCRAKALRVLHVHHDDPNPKSGFRLGTSGGEPMPCALPSVGEPVFVKHGSSAFIGTGLEAYLRDMGVTRLVIVGAAVNYCVASTLRMAANLGFDVVLPQDAVFGFGVTGPDGVQHSPETVLSVTLGTLAEFAAIVSSDTLHGFLVPH
ncbi:isochorismatase family protein [Pseudorhodobacter ferrugineus]|uniref:isochorismatase family protein n=1 Tax=Pseudorhodobacter ferrugineus TaxID=77008 RepID=UPI0003F83797|nr:isochorismatase family protein [Pseudorhodobacter ferrugineus]